MATRNQDRNPAEGNTPQGDNRRAGDVDGNRGAKPQAGSQGVNKSAGNQADSGQRGDDRGDGTEHHKRRQK